MGHTSLTAFLQENIASDDLKTALTSLAQTGQAIGAAIAGGAIDGTLGLAGEENVQGEQQKALDVIANDMLKKDLSALPCVQGVASEEEPDPVAANPDGSLLISFDPLDGSSNIDINSLVGTIFSILPSQKSGTISESDFLQSGRQQLAAGYILYGPAMMMVFSTGAGTHLFAFSPALNDFALIDPAMQIPVSTQEFAINMSNQRFWAKPMQDYIAELLAGKDGPRGSNYNMRWIAAMVGDVHRVLCRGGLFTYPWDSRNPDKAGKLRLMYEANPMALLVEQAGGRACTDSMDILDVQPDGIHQRVPVILGSKEEVEYCLAMHH